MDSTFLLIKLIARLQYIFYPFFWRRVHSVTLAKMSATMNSLYFAKK